MASLPPARNGNGDGVASAFRFWLTLIASVIALLAAFWSAVARPNVREVAMEEAAKVRAEAKLERAEMEKRADQRLERIERKIDELLVRQSQDTH